MYRMSSTASGIVRRHRASVCALRGVSSAMNTDRTFVVLSMLGWLTACVGARDDTEGLTPDVNGVSLQPLLGAAVAREAAAPELAITSIRTEGDCEVGSALAGRGAPGEVWFSRFEAAVDLQTNHATSTCDVHLTVQGSEGYALALEELSTEGMVTLADGTTARVEVDYRVDDVAGVAGRARIVRGPIDGPHVFFADFAGDDRTFGPCVASSMLTVRLKLAASTHGAPAAGKISLTRFRPLTLAVRPCEAPR
jgi:hypothetical protein